ncbi:hypothetical protein F53441_10682 [Fusarium austroafricanum]|uniref:Uncharacterized protein n=1 Tax=Fusarium austroafricanum TaxID=2364996 RepID=A0A8H4KA90_9HYPO|nr:hypothetical protein F53441_10682 [Fusarium austroafricanum]
MVTVTEYFGHTVVNYGPLTTTYTPPASCTTVTTDHIYYAKANATAVDAVIGVPTCEPDLIGKCLPSGDAYDKGLSRWAKQGGQNNLGYFSPGVVCPKGWTTVGTLAHGDTTGSANKSGIFTQDLGPLYHNLSPERLWLGILEPSETLALCCPSGWIANAGGACYSSIKPFRSATYTAKCFRSVPATALTQVFTVEGTPEPSGIVSFATGDYPSTTRAISSLDRDQKSELEKAAIVREFAVVRLVYKDSDMKASKDGGNDKGDDNGASALSRDVSFIPMIMVLFSMLFGAGLLIPRF